MKSIRVTLAAWVLVLLVAGSANAAGQQVVFLVRHAERAASPAPAPPAGNMSMIAAADDPPLSPAGQERATRLAAILRSSDIKQIFTTELLRTRQSAGPAAQGMHVEITQVPAKNLDALVAQIRQATGNTLVVGHSNTVPDILKRLGVKDDVTIADTEYDNLFIVVLPEVGGPEVGGPTLIRLRY